MAYLRWLLAYFEGDVALVAAAYNAGEGAVERYRGVPPYAETRAYVQAHPGGRRRRLAAVRREHHRSIAAAAPDPRARSRPLRSKSRRGVYTSAATKPHEERTMYERILVPVDGSRFSEQILPYVHWISGKTGVALTLLRVVDKDDDKPQAQSALEALGASCRRRRSARRPAATSPEPFSTGGARPGHARGDDLHGRSGVMPAILGSTALKLLRTGREPIFVFRPQDADASPGPATITGSSSRSTAASCPSRF